MLERRELIVDGVLVALYHSLAVVGLFAVLGKPVEVLLIQLPKREYPERRRHLAEVLNDVDDERTIVLLFLKHLENELLQSRAVARVYWLWIFI